MNYLSQPVTDVLMIAGFSVSLTRKNIKNLHLKVSPPDGRIKISSPALMPLFLIKKFVLSKSIWIKTQQNRFKNYKYTTPKQFLTGELHQFFGVNYPLKIVFASQKSQVKMVENILVLSIKNDSTTEQKSAILDQFYRQNLKEVIPNLINKYQEIMQVSVDEFGVKKMKTRWGTCNPSARRIWLNLELCKKSPELLEYVVVHEMTHLLEASHNYRFVAFMDEFMVDWRVRKQRLNDDDGM